MKNYLKVNLKGTPLLTLLNLVIQQQVPPNQLLVPPCQLQINESAQKSTTKPFLMLQTITNSILDSDVLTAEIDVNRFKFQSVGFDEGLDQLDLSNGNNT